MTSTNEVENATGVQHPEEELKIGDYVRYDTNIEGVRFVGIALVRELRMHVALIRVQISERVPEHWVTLQERQEIHVPYEDLKHIPKPEYKTCPACEGLGYDPCSKCQASGQVPSNGIGSAPITCPKCKGTKVGPDECTICDGLTYLPFQPL